MQIEYEIYAPVGKFEKNGKERNKTRLVGHMYSHSDGKRFIGSDVQFLECVAPKGASTR